MGETKNAIDNSASLPHPIVEEVTQLFFSEFVLYLDFISNPWSQNKGPFADEVILL